MKNFRHTVVEGRRDANPTCPGLLRAPRAPRTFALVAPPTPRRDACRHEAHLEFNIVLLGVCMLGFAAPDS
ncbi:MAG: hypothetical protein ABI920_19450 [Casimicrobiaceae bacterium]